jgi:SAM-dependent methyltransferase
MSFNRREFERPSVKFEQVGEILVDSEWQKKGVTDQFLAHAETYDDRYFKSPYWRYLVERGLTFAKINRASVTRVLDIGSGSGNTVLPALEYLTNAAVIASDISPQLLKILFRHLSRSEHARRDVGLYCFDLHKDVFEPESFDLVIGGAVLHHMVDPNAALKNAARWLRPGGQIILYEPFDYGAHIFAVLFQLMVDLLNDSSDPNDQQCVNTFRAFRQDIEARLGVPVVKPWTANLDDKWYFNLTYLRELAASLKLQGPLIYPLTDNFDRHFNNNIKGMMSASGDSALTIRADAQALIDEFDQGISHQLKTKMIIEGIVVFNRL